MSEDGDSSGFVSASSSACASLVNTPSEEHDGSMESSSADSAADTDSTAAVAPERPARVVHGILQTPEEVKPSFLIRAVDQRGISVLAEINGGTFKISSLWVLLLRSCVLFVPDYLLN